MFEKQMNWSLRFSQYFTTLVLISIILYAPRHAIAQNTTSFLLPAKSTAIKNNNTTPPTASGGSKSNTPPQIVIGGEISSPKMASGSAAKSANTGGTAATVGSLNNTYGLSIGNKTFTIVYQITGIGNKLKRLTT